MATTIGYQGAPQAPVPGAAPTAASATPEDPNAFKSWGQTVDWSKTGWGAEQGLGGNNYYKPVAGTIGFTYGTGQAGYIDPQTGRIAVGNKVGIDNGPDIMNPNDPNQTYRSTLAGEAQYDPYADYGLGAGYEGIIPIAHDPQGRAVSFYAPGAGGGQAFGSLEEAKASADQWRAQNGQQVGAQAPTKPPALAEGGTYHPSTAATAGTGATEGVLMDPGASETFYDSTKDFYTGPTESKQFWDQTKNQPLKSEQNWNALSGQFNEPSASEGLWGNYSDIFSNPNYLDDYYDYQLKNAKGATEARAASRGVGDSSMATRAAGNLDALYSAQKLAGMEGFATTGMGLAQGADAGKQGRATTLNTLATNADNAYLSKLGAAGGVDAAELGRKSGGQVAANAAQQAQEKRLTGGLDYATQIGNDLGTLTASGMAQAEAYRFSTGLAAIQAQMTSGALTAEQAYQSANELLASIGAIGNAAATTMMMQRLGSGTTGSGQQVTNSYGTSTYPTTPDGLIVPNY